MYLIRPQDDCFPKVDIYVYEDCHANVTLLLRYVPVVSCHMFLGKTSNDYYLQRAHCILKLMQLSFCEYRFNIKK